VTRRWVQLLARSPGVALAVFLALTAVFATRLWDFGAGQPRLRVETAVDRILPDHDEERRFYEDFRDRFGSDEVVLLVLVADDVLTEQNLGRIRRITERVEALDGVRRVLSVANALDVRAAEDGIRVEPFLERVPRGDAALGVLRERVFGNPVYAGNLVSRDGRASALLVYPHDMSETEFRRRGIDRQIEAVAIQEKGDADVVLGGAPPVKAATSRLILRDAITSAVAGLIVTAVIGWLGFRSAWGALLPLICVGFGQLYTLAVMASLGRPLNLVTAVVPPVVNAVGIAYGMHLVAELSDSLREGSSGRAAVWGALERVTPPVLLCLLTTVAGFLSLCTSNLAAIREFGIFCSVGATACAAAALWFLPCLLALRPPSEVIPLRQSRLPERAERLAHFDLRHRGPILAAGAALGLVALVGVTRIEVSTSLIHNFDEDHPLRVGFDRIDEHLKGANTLNVVIDGGEPEAFKTPLALGALREVQRWLDAQPEVGHTTSIADYVALIHRALHGDRSDELRIPDSPSLISKLFFFFWDEQLERLVDDRFATANLEVRVHAMESAGYAALVDRIGERLAGLPPGYSGRVTGNTVIVVHTIDDLARSQALSLATGLFSIGLLLIFYFRSLRVGLVALLPNVLPVLAYFGALGLFGVTLNPTTALVACLVLGVAVDDTLHYMARYRSFVRRGFEPEKAVVEAMRTVARPVLLTTLVLTAALLALATSQLKHQVEFGVLAAGTLLLAGVLDFTLTPVLASYLGRRAASDEWGRK
jgi:predicted RND superfamily exporter protein